MAQRRRRKKKRERRSQIPAYKYRARNLVNCLDLQAEVDAIDARYAVA